MEKDHSCCADKKQEPPGKETRLKNTLCSYALAPGAAFLACLCCSLPLIPLMIGLGSATLFSKQRLGQFHFVFQVGAIIILLAACGYMWKEHRKSGKPLRSFILLVLVTFAMYGVMTFAMQALLAPVLTGHEGMQMKNHHIW